MNVLIVDDNPTNLKLMRAQLEAEGLMVVEAEDGVAALELLNHQRVDVVISDILMPRMDGYRLCHEIRKSDRLHNLPTIIYSSTYTSSSDVKLAIDVGADKYLNKPASIEIIIAALHEVIAKPPAVPRVGALPEVEVLKEYSKRLVDKLEEKNIALEQTNAELNATRDQLGQRLVESHRLEAQFIEAQKMEVIGQLAGGVAHDFNNILAVIMGYSDLMMQEFGPDDPIHKNVAEIRHAADRAAGLTRQLLVFSRKQTVQPVVLDLNEVVNDLDKMLRRLIDENIEMTIVPGKQIGRIKGDSGYVGQVLMNLVVNARDAMPNGGKLTIATDNVTFDGNYTRAHIGVIPGDYVMLSVSDTGTGMTEEVKKRLFEAFFTTKPLGKGTGLGLATCQTIVQQCHGHIEVQSELGQGTTFKIYFPHVEQPLDVAARPGQTGPLPPGTETLLVVEDDPSLRHLACGVLEAQGYEVLTAANGQDALRVAREHKGSPIRLVITDVIMPLMGGKMMAEWLQTTYSDLKILFTSGYTDDALAQHGVLENGVEFLSKPYTPAILARKVRAMLDNKTDSALLLPPDLKRGSQTPDRLICCSLSNQKF
jgi:signal transduction histidine kinase